MKIIAIDAPPGNIQYAKDYSAYQLLSLRALPLLQPKYNPIHSVDIATSVAECISSRDGKNIKLTINDDLFFSSGESVLAKHYIDGLEGLYKNNVFIRQFFQPRIIVQSQNKKCIKIKLGKRYPPIYDLLSSILWNPINKCRSDDIAGRYSVYQESKNYWKCTGNQYSRFDNPNFEIRLIKDPLDNIRLARLGIITQTPDTATPYEIESLDGFTLNRRPSPLRAQLSFFSTLANPENTKQRHLISEVVSELNIANLVNWESTKLLSDEPCVNKVTGRINTRIEQKPAILKRSKRKRLTYTLAYDDYYPNATIAYAIAQQLEQFGIEVTVIADDFSNQKANCDMRLNITHGLLPSVWGRYCGQLTSSIWKSTPQYLEQYLRILLSEDPIEVVSSKLDSILNKVCPSVQIGAVPSLYFIKEN
ncbi:hypothetical protein ACXHQJ_14630 [Vibrio vulnificus]